MKRVLFLINSLYGGGAEKVLQTILNNLDLSRYEVTLCSVVRDQLNEQYPKGIHYSYVYNSTRGRKTSRIGNVLIKIENKLKLFLYQHASPALFYSLFVRGQYDTVIAFIEGYATRIVSGAKDSCHKIAWVHIDMSRNHWSSVAYKSYEEEKQSYQKYDSIVCVSENVKESMLKVYGELNCLMVLYNPIDDQLIREQSTAADPVFRHRRRIKLISIGRLVEQKGYDRLLPIAKHLLEKGYQFDLIIIGEGPELRNLQSYIDSHNMSDYVHLLGYLENPYPDLLESDLFICSSRSEGYSTVLTEAMILGVPVITTRCAGVNELLDGGECGMIVDNDSDALERGLEGLFLKQDKLLLLKKKAARRGESIKLSELISKLQSIL